VHVKVFHGDRRTHEVSVSILDKVQKVIDELMEREPSEMKKYYELRLLMPKGRLLNLSEHLDKTFLELKISHRQKMVLVG
jgi:hypothetical protein